MVQCVGIIIDSSKYRAHTDCLGPAQAGPFHIFRDGRKSFNCRKSILTHSALHQSYQTIEKGILCENDWPELLRVCAMTAVVTLQERLDFGAVSALKSELLGHAGQDLEIDAGSVAHMGTLCLQVLLAAAKDWGMAGHKFSLTASSDTCTTQLALHGFSPETLAGN